MYKTVRSKLSLLDRDVHRRKLHFPHLQEQCEINKIQEDPKMKEFLTKLPENYKERLESPPELSVGIRLFLNQPLSFSSQWSAEAKKLLPSIDEAALKVEVLEIRTSISSKHNTRI